MTKEKITWEDVQPIFPPVHDDAVSRIEVLKIIKDIYPYPNTVKIKKLVDEITHMVPGNERYLEEVSRKGGKQMFKVSIILLIVAIALFLYIGVLLNGMTPEEKIIAKINSEYPKRISIPSVLFVLDVLAFFICVIITVIQW